MTATLHPTCLPRLARIARLPRLACPHTQARPPPGGPSQDPLPSVSSGAAAIARNLHETPPELEQSTPIAEVASRDRVAQWLAPEIPKPAVRGTRGHGERNPKRSYSTAASAIPGTEKDAQVDKVEIHAGLPHGAKFPLPDLPLPPGSRLDKRYSPIVDQVTNLLMRDGKKATAQANVTKILSILRTHPPPRHNPRVPILASAPPLESLPSDPVAYLQTAVDSVAPLVRIQMVKASGGSRDPVPVPLSMKQRRRKAVMWMLAAADKKKPRLGLAERFAEEIVSVIEGRSSAWERRLGVHRQAVVGRANVKIRV